MKLGKTYFSGSITFDEGNNVIGPSSATFDTITVSNTLNVTGNIAGAATTASYVEFTDIANKPTLISSSAQIASDISGSITSVSSSLASRISSNEGSVSSLNQASSSYLLNTSDTLDGDLTVTGRITAQEFHTEFVSASILYDSGSTKFGNSGDDIHFFTGSVGIGVNSPNSALEVDGNIYLSNNNNNFILFGTSSNIDAYIQSDSTQNLALGSRNGSKLFISSSGRVGVGTTSPESKLAVKGSSGNADLFSISDITVPTSGTEYGVSMIKTNSTEYALNITSYNANGKGIRIYNNGGQNAFLVSQAGGDRFVIDGSGNIGIGTNSPETKLHVIGTDSSGARTSPLNVFTITAENGNDPYDGFGGAILFKNRIYNGGPSPGGIREGVRIRTKINTNSSVNYGTDLVFENTETGDGALQTRMVLLYNGRLGIGTTSPSQLLHVNGYARFNGYQLWETGGTISGFVGYEKAWVGTGSSNNLAISAEGSNGISFFTNGTASQRMFIDTSGNVGIGTTSAGSRLTVVGGNSGNTPLIDLKASGTGTFQRGVRLLNAGMNAGDHIMYAVGQADGSRNMGQTYFYFAGAGSTSNRISMGLHSVDDVFNILGTGYVGIGTTSPTSPLHLTAATPTLNLEATATSSPNGIEFIYSGIGKRAGINVNYNTGEFRYEVGVTGNTYYKTFHVNGAERMAISSAGYVYIGDGYSSSNHRVNLKVSQGNTLFVVSGYNSTINDSLLVYGADGYNVNGNASTIKVTTNDATGRSINAGGTINASGSDYAEYMLKATADNIQKGDIVGVDINGKLTNIFTDSISFVIKSTDPSYVGGDSWFNNEKRPEKTTNQTEEEFATILKDFEDRVNIEREKVDRIAFSGQVPCNVYNANVGDYIIPISTEDGKITGQAVSSPTFEQYQIAVGKVWKIMEDGRAWVAVKIG